jgi:hypothetical protein
MAIIKPFIASRRFDSTVGAGTGVGAAYNILATAFPVPTYYNLYINSMIQEGDTSTISTTAITIPGGDAVDPATPIIVEVVVI